MFKNMQRGTELLTCKVIKTPLGTIPAGSTVLFNESDPYRGVVSIYFTFQGFKSPDRVEVSRDTLTLPNK
jgi:hypothetical protein